MAVFPAGGIVPVVRQIRVGVSPRGCGLRRAARSAVIVHVHLGHVAVLIEHLRALLLHLRWVAVVVRRHNGENVWIANRIGGPGRVLPVFPGLRAALEPPLKIHRLSEAGLSAVCQERENLLRPGVGVVQDPPGMERIARIARVRKDERVLRFTCPSGLGQVSGLYFALGAAAHVGEWAVDPAQVPAVWRGHLVQFAAAARIVRESGGEIGPGLRETLQQPGGPKAGVRERIAERLVSRNVEAVFLGRVDRVCDARQMRNRIRVERKGVVGCTSAAHVVDGRNAGAGVHRADARAGVVTDRDLVLCGARLAKPLATYC